MPTALSNAYAHLAIGGKLLFRDYGFCDMSQLRYTSEQILSPQHYIRKDGTLASYFKKSDIIEMAEACGFVTEVCEYHCLLLRNRRQGHDMKRVFVHGIFRKSEE